VKNKFQEKLISNQYISTFLYELVKKTNPEVIPREFNLEDFNDKILERNYLKYKDYFQSMYEGIDDNIILDKDQIKAIIADEDYSLILAGAGCGKTTTMASKVKYLVDIKKVNPEKIVVMSYTKKAVEELEKRIIIDFGINACVTTFHTLGLMHIREIFKNHKCYVVDDSLREKIFYEYFKEEIFPYKEKIEEILEYFNVNQKNSHFIFGNHFINNYYKYKNFDEYFESYKEFKLRETINLKEVIREKQEKDINREEPFTIKGELVKSKGEAIIANFLYVNGIDYYYEKIYKETMDYKRVYKPDFTLELNGEEVYLEYFGMLSDDTNYKRYAKIKKLKEEYHEKHHNKFIELTYTDEESLINTLKNNLLKLGFKLKPRSLKEIFFQILDNNKTSQIFLYKKFLYHIIDTIKSSSNRDNYKDVIVAYLNQLNQEEKELANKQLKYINDFYAYYQKKLYRSEDYGFDFSDMIYYANLYISKIGTNNNLNFDYLIIDEYQDISRDRYEFTKNIVKRNKAKVVAVGDDFQTIFSFAGSKIEYIYNFTKYFEGAKLFTIKRTYRNSQELVRATGKFIMKNESQIKKELYSLKNIYKPIRFVMFEGGLEYDRLKELILKIHKKNKEHSIMILGRTNKIINNCFLDSYLVDDIGTKIEFLGYEDIKIDGMTIHKSKGLTSDEVILIGLDNNFPKSNTGMFWLESLFFDYPEDESIPYAEERRLFYVAMTRSKNHVYLLVNKNPNLRSPFINEIYNIVNEEDYEKE